MTTKFDSGRRTTLKMMGLAAAAIALPLPISRAFAQASGKLTFMVAEYSPKTKPFWEAQVASFKAANPDADVTLEVINWQQMHDTTAQRIAAGSLPDLVNTATIWLPEWVDADAIQTIGPDTVSDKVKGDIIPALLDKGAAYKGEAWGLPIAAAARGMFYNKKLLAAAGVTDFPKDWAGFKAAVTAIKDKTGEFGYGFDGKGVQAFRYFGYFLWNGGGDFFTDDGKAAFNSEAGVNALKYLVDLANTGATPGPTGTAVEDLEPMFKAGKLAILADGNYLAAALKTDAPDIEYGVAAVPTSGPDVTPVTWGVTDTLVISKNANAPLAKAFIEHIYSTAARTEFDSNEGLLPVLKSQAGLPEFSDPATAAFADMLSTARFDPLNANYSQMQELVKTAMQQALTGTDAKTALDQAATAFDALAG